MNEEKNNEIIIKCGENQISGYIVKYGICLEICGFQEIFLKEAFDEAIICSNVKYDILGRINCGKLNLKSDSTGLYFEIDLPNIDSSKILIQEIKENVIKYNWAFTVEQDDWDDKVVPIKRIITKVGRIVEINLFKN